MNAKKIRVTGQGLKDRFISLLDPDLKWHSVQPAQDIYVFFSEEISLRIGGELMICLIVNLQDLDTCVIDIVSGGGKTGLLAGTSFGAEANRVKRISRSIEAMCKDNQWEFEVSD